MPCYTTGTREGDLELAIKNQADYTAKLEALVCALVREHGWDGVDWDKCGVSPKWADKWWKRHQARDKKRDNHVSR